MKFIFTIALLASMQCALANTISSTAAGGDWSLTTTWVGGVVPTSTDDVVIVAGSTVVVRSPYSVGAGAACNSITIDGTLTMGSGSAGNNRELDVQTFLMIDAGGTLNEAGNAFHKIFIGGDFTNNGTFTPFANSGSVQIILNGSGSQSISSINNSIAFDTLTIKGSVAQNVSFASPITSASTSLFRLSSGGFTAPSSLTTKDFVQSSGTFTAGSNLFVQGKFTHDAGTFGAGTGTVTFSGATQTIGGSAPTTFNSISILSGSSTTISTAPTINGDIQVNDGATLIVNPNITVNGKTTVGNGASGTLTILTGSPKIFNGLITVNSGATWDNSANESIHVGGGLTNLGTFTAGTGVYYFETNDQQINGNVTLSIANIIINLTNNGTFTVNSSIQNTGSLLQGANSILNIGGTCGSNLIASAAGNTVNYTGAAQSVYGINYVNLGLSGSGTKTLSTNTTSVAGNFSLSGTASATTVIPMTVGGQLLIGDGTTFNVADGDLTVTGATVIGNSSSGSLVFTSTGGTKTFVGNVTISQGGTWDNTIGKNIHLQNGLQNNGTFITGSEIYFFEVNNQSIGGTLTMANITVASGVTLTNNGIVTVSTNLSGNAMIQGLNSVLNIGGANPIASFDATTFPNAVNYTGTSQFVKGYNYYNLELSGNGTVTILSGLLSITKDFTISGALSTNNPNALQIGGDFTVEDGSTFNVSGYDFSVGGKTTIGTGTSGNLNITSSVGTKTFGGLVLLSAGATWDNSSGNSNITFQGGITNNGTFTSGTGIHTFSTNAQNLSGNFTIGSVNINSVTLTNKISLSVNTTLAGTGTLAQANGSALIINGTSSLANINASTATNDVTYNASSPTVIAGSYYNLTLNQPSGDATLLGNISINNNLSLNTGNLDIASNILTVATAANISIASPSAASMIIASGSGELRKKFTTTGSFTFPVGDNIGTIEYSPVTVTLTAGSGFTNSYIGISVANVKHPNNNSTTDFLTRYWTISQSGIAGCIATINGTYVPTDITGTEANISSAQLNGTFDQMTNGWKIFTVLGNTTLSASGVTLSSGKLSALTGITNIAPSVAITGGGVVACSGSPVSLGATTTGTPGFIYSWSPATGLSAPSSANTTVTISSSTTYTLTVYDGNGISASDVSTITILSLPNVTVNSPTICTGETATLTATGAVSYTWSSGLSSTTGATVTGSPANTATFIVTGTDINNCSKTASATITVNPIPDKPTITASGLNTSTPTLTSSSAVGNQWSDNGTAITGATSQAYHPASSGSYSVKVTANGCTSPASDVYALVVTGIEANYSDGLRLYPNPAGAQLNIDWGVFTANGPIEVRIYDLLGQQVGLYNLTANDTWLNVSHLAAGQFIFQATQGNQLSTQRFLKK